MSALFYLYVYGTVCIVLVGERLLKRYPQPHLMGREWPYLLGAWSLVMTWPLWILPVLVRGTRS